MNGELHLDVGSFQIGIFMRHGAAITRLLGEMPEEARDSDRLFCDQLADDAANFVWGCLMAREAERSSWVIRAVRNDVADAIRAVLEARDLAGDRPHPLP